MWFLSGVLFAVCKGLAWHAAPDGGGWRRWAFLLAWPGMDARAFLRGCAVPPKFGEGLAALAKTLLGAGLYFGVARCFDHPLAVGWVGMIGIIFLLHFGSFHLLSVFWRAVGVDARPIMRWPVAATSLGEFWGRRWNLAFNELAERFVFRPAVGKWGVTGASLAAFLASGVLHELVISLPAGAGWGLPTGYFFLQGCGAAFERSRIGRRWGLRRGWRGRAFTLFVAAGPAFLLFHPPFVRHVIVPMMQATGAL
uniref:Membrane protein n=1 Tax=uncultured Verrucomicrobiota bacterium TaxID=156588 RepID=D2DXX6_9BACT|nr:membrane protein [uncultured Verrucomicrobiota bacterium]